MGELSAEHSLEGTTEDNCLYFVTQVSNVVMYCIIIVYIVSGNRFHIEIL